MSSWKDVRRACGLGVAAALVAAAAYAQPSDKRTFFTFSRPITLPGITLPPGKYLFRLADDQTTRKVIQVASADGTKPYAMLPTISNERRDAPRDAEVSFLETAPRTPSAVKAWWYPGERTGYEFIYPRAQARRLAQAAGTSVLTTKADTAKTEDTRTGELTRIEAGGRDQAAAAPPPVAQNPVPNPPPIARYRLPQTATPLPLAGLIGVLSIVVFSSVRLWRANR